MGHLLTVLTTSAHSPQKRPDPHRALARSEFPRTKPGVSWSSREFGIGMLKDHRVTRALGLGEKSYCMSVKDDVGQVKTVPVKAMQKQTQECAEKIRLQRVRRLKQTLRETSNTRDLGAWGWRGEHGFAIPSSSPHKIHLYFLSLGSLLSISLYSFNCTFYFS